MIKGKTAEILRQYPKTHLVLAKKNKQIKEDPKKTVKPAIQKSQKAGMLSLAVFIFSISIVLISLVSVVFPALIVSSGTIQIPGVTSVTPYPYEIGVWAGSMIAANIIVFAIAILYFKNKLPNQLSKSLKAIFEFEVSKKVTVIVLAILFAIYITVTINELETEETWKDYFPVKERIEESIRIDRLSIRDAIAGNPNYPKFEPHVKYTLLFFSIKLFDNLKVIPFLASIALLITTYFITKKLSNKRFAGIIAVVIILQSQVFRSYDTSVAYTNFWILFYLLSLYLVFKVWPLSPLSYLLSILSKAITPMFLPMSLFFILNSNISRRKKIVTSTVTFLIVLIGGIAIVTMGLQSTEIESIQGFDSKELWMGFTSFAFQLRFDGLLILFILPLIVGLFIASRNGIKNAGSIMVLISGMLLIPPLLTGFTEQTNQPYRFIPLLVFFAIGVGVLLSKRINSNEKSKEMNM